MRSIDANGFPRLLANDDPDTTTRCLALFEWARAGDEELAMSEAIVDEHLLVLTSKCHDAPRPDEARARVKLLLQLTGLCMPFKQTRPRAPDLYVEHASLNVEDALAMERLGVGALYSYAADLDRAGVVTRVEP